MAKTSRLALEHFYRNKRVFITGHTGFKGTWLCHLLLLLGAQVTGFSNREYDFYTDTKVSRRIRSYMGDIRDYAALKAAIEESRPEIVFHLAAQPLVLESYQKPLETYSTNVMGTIHLLESCRHFPETQAVVVVTTDKVYENTGVSRGYHEDDRLCGSDPYSNSKSCAELATEGYRQSYYEALGIPLATARAGNVIGGGDFSLNRIIPDCVRAFRAGEPVVLRHSGHVRPWQHVLDPLCGYLLLGKALCENSAQHTAYNLGPNYSDCVPVGKLVEIFALHWGDDASWQCAPEQPAPHESAFLKLDCSLARQDLGWLPVWNVNQALKACADWYRHTFEAETMHQFMEKQIAGFLSEWKSG